MPENFKRLLAHKLGNLVMLARNPVELLDEPDIPLEHQEQLRAMLIDSLDNMEQMCRDLTDLGRTEELSGEPLNTFQLETSMANIIQQYTEAFDSSKHSFVYRACDVTPLPVYGQQELVERAVQKLIDNAIKFTPNGSVIEVELEVVDDQAIVRVTDQGLGIPPEHLETIFEPFHRVKNRHTMQLAGLGLGLSVASAIAAAHGGTITASSVLDVGSVFTLRLPIDGGRG